MRQAIEQELITRDRASEILRITPEKMIERIGDWVGQDVQAVKVSVAMCFQYTC